MKKGFYKIEDCDGYTATNKSVLEIILEKIEVFKRIYTPGPFYIFLDKKSYKELNYKHHKDFGFTKRKMPIKSILGFRIKIVKSKERIICVGV